MGEDLYGDAAAAKAAKDDGSEEEKVSSVNGARNYGILTIALGIVLLGCLMPILTDLENYNNIKDPLSEVGSPLATQFGLPFYLIGAVVLLIGGGSASLFGYFKNNQMVVIAGMFCSLAAAGLTLFVCLGIRGTLDQLFDKLQGNPVTDKTFGDAELSALEFTGAIFNECCFSLYDSQNYSFGSRKGPLINEKGQVVDLNQKPVPVCQDTLGETCPNQDADRMFPEVVNTVLNSLDIGSVDDLLCHCYTSQTNFDKFVEIFRRDDLCNKYRNIRIKDAGERLVPVINQNFNRLMTLAGTTEPAISPGIPIAEMALVGKFLPKFSTFGEDAEDVGFSCGIGYAKAVALNMFFFINDKVKVMEGGGYFVAAAAGASTVLLGLWWLCGNSSGAQLEDAYADDEYETHTKRSKLSEPEVKTPTGSKPRVGVLDIVDKRESKPAKSKPKDEYDEDYLNV